MDPLQLIPSQFPAESQETDHEDESPVVKGRFVHQFYMVKLQPYQDPELESAIKRAQGVLRKMCESRGPIVEDFELRKMDRDKLTWNRYSHRFYRHRVPRFVESSWKRSHRTSRLDFLQRSLQKLTFNEDWEKQVKELHRRLVHDQRPGQARERKIFKELNDLLRIKELVDHRSQAEENAEIIERLGSEFKIRREIERLQTSSGGGMTKENRREFECVRKQEVTIEKDLRSFEGKLLDLNKEKAKAHECILDSTKLQAIIKADYDEYVATSNRAKELAMKNDIMGLQELINRANDRFMSKWSNEKRFREVYKKRVASSLERRGLNMDGMLKDTVEE